MVFIHLEKTGGATLHNVLKANYAPERASPSHYSYLSDFSLIDNTYDLFSCHIDYDTALRIPRASKQLVALFREPTERLISQYRFWRSHPVSGSSAKYDPSRLAKELSPEEFFNHQYVRPLPMINNYYLTTFWRLQYVIFPCCQLRGNSLKPSTSPCNEARLYPALGLTHRMRENHRAYQPRCWDFRLSSLVRFEYYEPSQDGRASGARPRISEGSERQDDVSTARAFGRTHLLRQCAF